MGKPTLLFLDEPTSSIDPESRKEIWDILLNLKENPNMITILTTHHFLEKLLFLAQLIRLRGHLELGMKSAFFPIAQ